MKQTLVALTFLLLVAAAVQARVILPDSGRLAGPLNVAASEIGTEFFFVPEAWGTAPPGKSPQSGWLEIQFGIPEGPLVPFRVFFQGIGPDVVVAFSGGQRFVYGEQAVRTLDSLGLLNLETGVVEEIVVAVEFTDTGISRNSVPNRTDDTFDHVYPTDFSDAPLELPPLPPGFVHVAASFSYDAEGRIRGFDFTGAEIAPFGILGLVPFFPEYSFGAYGEAHLAVPSFCAEGTPPEHCPDEREARNGIPAPPFPFSDPTALPTLVHPHTFIHSSELREVEVEAPVPACAPRAATDAVGAAAGGKLYLIGGATSGRERGRVDRYDPTTRLWEPAAPMPVPVIAAQGERIGGEIFVVGGRRSARGPALDTLQIYDPRSDTWRLGSSAPWPVAHAATAVKGERLYVFGGQTNRPNGSRSGNLRYADAVQVYDPASDQWQQLPATVDGEPIYVADAAAVVDGVDIYLLNGRVPGEDGERVSDQMLIFDTLNDVFRAGPPTLWGVYQAAAVRIGKRTYLAGGRSSLGGESERRMQIFEPEQGAWHRGLDAPLPVSASAVAAAGERLYALGGRAMGGADAYPGPATGVLQLYDPGRGWRTCDTYPVFTAGEVMSAAALLAGPPQLAPGTRAVILGHHLAEVSAVAPPGVDVPTVLAGVRVSVDGEPAPVLSVSPGRIDFQIPYTVRTARGTVGVVVDREGSRSPAVEVPIAAAAPHIFVQYCGSERQILMQEDASSIACHGDGSLNYADFPVAPGATVQVQMTGLGAVDTPLRNGQRAPAGSAIEALQLPSVSVEQGDGTYARATVLSAVLAPGEVGIYDVEIVVPAGSLISNRTFLTATVGGITSNRAGVAVGTPTTADPVACKRDTDPSFRACALEPPPAAAMVERSF